MEGVQWLNGVAARVRDQLTAVDISQLEPETLTLAYGLRCVVLYANGEQALLSPSVSVGGAVASGAEDRVQHLEIGDRAVRESTTPPSLSRPRRPLLICAARLCDGARGGIEALTPSGWVSNHQLRPAAHVIFLARWARQRRPYPGPSPRRSLVWPACFRTRRPAALGLSAKM
jgi:hypothetical protein